MPPGGQKSVNNYNSNNIAFDCVLTCVFNSYTPYLLNSQMSSIIAL